MTPDQIEKAIELFKEGIAYGSIALRLNIPSQKIKSELQARGFKRTAVEARIARANSTAGFDFWDRRRAGEK